MSIALECLPVLMLLGCLLYLIFRIKRRGFLYILSLIYLLLQFIYKTVSLLFWQTAARSILVGFGALLTAANYVLMFLIFRHVLRNSALYSDGKSTPVVAGVESSDERAAE